MNVRELLSILAEKTIAPRTSAPIAPPLIDMPWPDGIPEAVYPPWTEAQRESADRFMEAFDRAFDRQYRPETWPENQIGGPNIATHEEWLRLKESGEQRVRDIREKWQYLAEGRSVPARLKEVVVPPHMLRAIEGSSHQPDAIAAEVTEHHGTIAERAGKREK